MKPGPGAGRSDRRAPAPTGRGAPQASPDERQEAGRARRRLVARTELARAPGAGDRQRDPIGWLQHSNQGRVPELVPLRHGRMLASPFAFYRGAAALMAHDLGALPHSGVTTQLCGDAHLSNFGFFASPERTLLFDLNDFDETLHGPFDWDLRRLAASFAIAAREIGLKDRDGREAVWMLADAYRDRLARFARMDTLEQWYYRLTSDTLLELGGRQDHELEVIRKARRSTSQVFAENAVERVPAGGDPVRPAHLNIVDRPPFVYHDAQATRRELDRLRAEFEGFLATYRASLASERRVLLSRYELHDIAVMTPGVGSVGRRCFLLLLVADGVHPLFLQCKEAGASVLESHAGASPFEHDGERIVSGQRLMQAASDIFLGWAGTAQFGEFYVRQLRDMKASFKLEQFRARDLVEYAEACGYALARAHAKAGDPWMLFGYVGRSKSFNRALVDFAAAYADVNEADWSALAQAVRTGRMTARTEAESV